MSSDKVRRHTAELNMPAECKILDKICMHGKTVKYVPAQVNHTLVCWHWLGYHEIDVQSGCTISAGKKNQYMNDVLANSQVGNNG